MLPMFKKAHINTRDIEEYMSKGVLNDYSEDANKRNALKQAAGLFKMVNGELYRHGSDREYKKYGLRIVVHDDEPQRKLDIISKCHIDAVGNHFGMNNTIKNVNNMYYWHGMSSHVKMFLKKCEYCKERSRFSMEEWLEEEKKNLSKRREMKQDMSTEIKNEIKSLGRIRKPTPPETFFIVNAERKIDFDNLNEGAEMLIDSNNIEYVVETLGNSETGAELKEVCHVLNVPDIVSLPERFRSREIETFLKYGSFPADFTANMRSGLKGPAVQYSIIDGELYHDANKKNNSGLRLVIHDDNPALKVKVMVESHLDEDGNHHGLNRTMNKVSEKYFWSGLSLDVKKFMQHCKICSKNRGKRLEEDTSKFADEVKKLKAKEENTSNEDVTYTVGEDGMVTDSNNQVFQLVGEDETEVTEITVKYIDGKIVQAVRDKGPEVVELTESQIQALEEVTETVTIEQEAETNPETIIASKEQGENDEDTTVVSTRDEQEIDAEVPLVIAAGSTGQGEDSGEKQDNVTAEVEHAHTDNGTENTVSVETAIKLLVDNEVFVKEGFPNTVTISTDGTITSENEAPSLQMNFDSDTFYDNMIYVPKLKKTRAMEEFLKTRTATFGFTTTKLRELTTNYFLEDNVLYRRPSRYKGKQVVIHDDQPMLKLRILKQHHKKPNGDHCRELVTYMNVQYKFYWEELRLDVNRYFRSCAKCVRDGLEVATNKRVLNEEELLIKEEESRKRDAGINAIRNRQFREEHKNRLETFRSWEKFGKDMTDKCGKDILKARRVPSRPEIILEEMEIDSQANFEDDVVELDEESDVDINLDEEDSEVDDIKSEESVLTVYATRAQEEMIRKMFQDRGWSYNLDSMTRCPDQSQKSGDDDLHVMVMKTTTEQDTAIQELFSASTDETKTMEASDGTNQDNVEIPVEINACVTQPPVDDVDLAEYTVMDLQEEIDKAESKNVIDTQPEAEDQTLPDNVGVDNEACGGAEPENNMEEIANNAETLEKDGEQTEAIKIKKQYTEIENEESEGKTVVNKDLKRGKGNKRSKEEVTKSNVEAKKGENGKGKKRAAIEVSETPTESRRPRREIKRPRRFSPDRMEEEQKQMSPKKTPKVNDKSKSSSIKESEEIVNAPESDNAPVRGRRQTKLGNDSKSISDNKVNTPKINKSVTKPDKTVEVKSLKTHVTGTRTRSKKVSSSDVGVTELPNTVKKVDQPTSQTRSSPRGKATLVASVAVVSTDTNDKKKATNKKGTKNSLNKLNVGKVHESVDTDEDHIQDSDPNNEISESEIIDDEMSDDEIIGDDEDDGFTDDEEVDDDCPNDGTVDRTALQVLKIDKEYEMEIICGDGIYMCSLCDAEFQSENDCVIHGMQNKCYESCTSCGKIFKKNAKADFNKHMALHKSIEKELCCPSCKKSFVDTHSLNIHLRVHANLKKETCDICDSTFYTSFQLASHMYRLHNKSNQFFCDVCNAKFVNINFMRSEILFDGALSYFKCVMCVR